MPTEEVLDKYYNQLLPPFPEKLQDIERKYQISFAEAKDYTYTLIKSKVIEALEQKEKSS